MKNMNLYKKIAITILILTVIFFVYTITKYNILQNKITRSAKTFGLMGVGLFSFILDFLPQYISPHIFIITSKFFEFNVFVLLLMVIIGSSVGSMAGFEIGKKIKHKDGIFDFIGKKRVKLFEKGINGWKKFIVSLAAISPLPYIPLILGMFNMSRKNFIIYGIIPRIIGFIVLGILFI